MNRKKSFLKNIDNALSDKISENYPAEWDMDKVFELSCKKYLALKKNTESDLRMTEAGDTLEFSETEKMRKKSIFHIFTINKLIAAACVAAIVMLIKMMFSPSQNIDAPPDIIVQNPIASQEKRTTSVNEKNVQISTVLHANVIIDEDTVCVTIPLEPIALDSSTAVADETEPPHDEAEPLYYDEDEYPEQTEVPIQTDVIETTKTEPSQTTEATETELPPTTEPMTTTVAVEQKGYFKFNKGGYHSDNSDVYENYDELVYIPPSNAPVEKKEHIMDSEEFSVCAENPYDASKSIPKNCMYIKAEESGHIYLVYTYDYEELSIGWTPHFKHYFEYFEINGRPALYENDRLQPDERYDYIMLMWDDGCHISFTFNLAMYYDEMLRLAECF